MQKKIPIGESDFKFVRTEHYYIDKTLLIKDVIDGNTSQLITRPRRFGKTLNMTMLRYFYTIQEDNQALFQGLNIATEEGGKYLSKCGKHPVIYMTFKDLKSLTWKDMYPSFVRVILAAARPFTKILTSEKLVEENLQLFARLFAEKTTLADLQNFLKTLCEILFHHYGTKAVILIDEYDTPVIAGYNYGYYGEIVAALRSFLSSGLKDNPYLEKGVLTGITRISKESLFSGLNNFSIYSILETKMADKFGFTQGEVHQMLADFDIKGKDEEVKLWYNNYQFGEIDIYNPWSIINFVSQEGKHFKPFWVNTSDNVLIREMMFQNEASIRNNLEDLIRGKWLKIHLEENLSFPDLKTSIDAVWNLLLFAGYLRCRNIGIEDAVSFCEVSIPNLEVLSIYKRFIRNWVETQVRSSEHEDMLAALLTGQVNIFRKLFTHFVECVFSFHDTAGEMPEKFYHAFFLGLLVKLSPEYHIFSNKEIGFGRADICLVPKKDKNKLGIIIELKSPDKKIDKETLAMGLELAEKQIIAQNYAAIMPQYEIANYIALAISVQGKKTLVKQVMV